MMHDVPVLNSTMCTTCVSTVPGQKCGLAERGERRHNHTDAVHSAAAGGLWLTPQYLLAPDRLLGIQAHSVAIVPSLVLLIPEKLETLACVEEALRVRVMLG